MVNSTNEDRYYFVMHGVPAEFYPIVAFRRSGQSPRHKRKAIKCPYCSELLMEVDRAMKVELYRYVEHSDVSCNAYRKCGHCRKEIGFNLV